LQLLLQFLLFSVPKIAEQEEKYESYMPYTDSVTMDTQLGKHQETGTFVHLIISETIQQGQLQNKSHHYDH